MIIHKVIELRKDKPVKFCTGRRLKVTRVFFKKAKCASYFDAAAQNSGAARLTYYEWFDKKVNPAAIVKGNISIQDFGAIVAREVFRGDIVEFKEKVS